MLKLEQSSDSSKRCAGNFRPNVF